MKIHSLRTQLAALAIVGAASAAHAAEGVLLVQKITTGAASQTSEMQIEKSRMRATITGPTGASQTIVFDGGKQVLYVIDASRKTYMELTKADVDQIGAQVQGMMSMMQAQMANMPPAQRAQMEAMMARGAGMAGMAAAKTEHRRGGSDKAGRWTCDLYETFQNGQKTGEICTVAPTALGFTAADLAVTSQMATFMSAIMPQASGQLAVLGTTEQQGFSGIPVKQQTSVNGQQVSVELTDASRQTFADSLFAVPAGFQKQDIMAGMGGGGRGR